MGQLDELVRSIVREEVGAVLRAHGFAPQTAQEFLAVSEAAQLARRTAETVRDWVASGKLPRYGTEGKILVRREDLDAFLKQPRRGKKQKGETVEARATAILRAVR